jgi:hypothetical protein
MGEQWLRGPHMPRSISHEDIGEEAKVMDSDEPGLGLGGRAGWDFFFHVKALFVFMGIDPAMVLVPIWIE